MPDENDPTMGRVTMAEPIPSPGAAMTQTVTAGAIVSRAVEEWARMKRTPAWLLKAAAVGARWQMGPEFESVLATEAEFDRAVAFANNPHAVVNAPKPKK